MANKPLILVTNDDGITSKGIHHLTELMQNFGRVVVVAPNSPQSAKGHAITINHPLEVYESNLFKSIGIEAYETSGTPADCVKLAKHYLLKNQNIDLLVSGINHGDNSSISTLYSATVSAALEAAIEGIPSIAFSVCDYGMQAVFQHTSATIHKIAQWVLNNNVLSGVTLNVNFPAYEDFREISGIRICRQAKAIWVDQFEEKIYEHGQNQVSLSGYLVTDDDKPDSDIQALKEGYASVVPIQFDLTHYPSIQKLQEIEQE